MPDSWSSDRKNAGKSHIWFQTWAKPRTVALWGIALCIAYVGWSAISYVLIPLNRGAIEGVERLETRLSIKPDDTITLEEDYRLRTENDGQSTFAGIARFVRMRGSSNAKFRCEGKLNGKPVSIQSSSFRDSVLVFPVVTPIASTGNDSFQVSCDISGLVERSGYERSLVLPLTDARLSVSTERLSAQIFFLFPPNDSSVGRPRLRATLDVGGHIEDLPIIQEQSNVFSLSLDRHHSAGSEVLLKATWRPPA